LWKSFVDSKFVDSKPVKTYNELINSRVKPEIYCYDRVECRLAQFWQDFLAKALVLVNPKVLEIIWQNLLAKALVLVNPTILEIFWQDLLEKALVLVNPTVLEIFWHDFYRSHEFG
jgi:hypothetical protein